MEYKCKHVETDSSGMPICGKRKDRARLTPLGSNDFVPGEIYFCPLMRGYLVPCIYNDATKTPKVSN